MKTEDAADRKTIYNKIVTARASVVKYPSAAVTELAAPSAPVCCAAAWASVPLAVGMGEGVPDPDPVACGLAATLLVAVAVAEELMTGLLGLALTSPSLAFAMAATHFVTSSLCWMK